MRATLSADTNPSATRSQSAEEQATELLMLLRAGSEAQRSAVVRFRRFAFDSQSSSRVAQFALEEATANEGTLLFRALSGHVREAIKSMFANYVVQRAVELL